MKSDSEGENKSEEDEENINEEAEGSQRMGSREEEGITKGKRGGRKQRKLENNNEESEGSR